MNESVTFEHTGNAQAVSQDLEISRLKRDVEDASSVLKRCEIELKAWMRVHGTDIDSQNLVCDVAAVLKKLKQ